MESPSKQSSRLHIVGSKPHRESDLPKKYESKQAKLDKHHEFVMKLLPDLSFCPVCGEPLKSQN